MEFEGVLGQEQARAFLQAALARNRVGHAYMFSGPDGTGKTLVALALAGELLCGGERGGSSGRERRMVRHGTHPDLRLVEAEEGKRAITIDQARELRRTLSLRPVQSERRVTILREADRLTDEAANALLKTLEEPPAYAVLILTTAVPRNLPDTIRSRCQEVRFAPLSPEHIEMILSKRPEFAGEEAALASRLALGSAGRAIRAIEWECIARHPALLERVAALPEEDAFTLADDMLVWLRTVSSKLEPQRERLREGLRLLVCAYRDMLWLQAGGARAGLLHRDPPTCLAALARRLTRRRLMAIVEALWTARQQVDRNAASSLVLESLFTRVGEMQRAT